VRHTSTLPGKDRGRKLGDDQSARVSIPQDNICLFSWTLDTGYILDELVLISEQDHFHTWIFLDLPGHLLGSTSANSWSRIGHGVSNSLGHSILADHQRLGELTVPS
jgi:hypothetical protein